MAKFNARATMKIYLHLGAHKTATTYLQMRLQRNATLLARAGVYVPPLLMLRQRLTSLLGPAARPGLSGFYRRSRLTRELGALSCEAVQSGASRMVLSDENLIGGCNKVTDRGEFYPKARRRLAALARALPQEPCEVMLALRSYAGFYTSAYGEWLRIGGRFRPFDQSLKQQFITEAGGWPGLVADIRAAFPAARLTVWDFDDWSDLEPIVLARMVGPAAQSLSPLTERLRAGLSARAVAVLAEAAATGTPPDADTVSRLIATYPKGRDHPAFDPWTAAEHSLLAARYAADLAQIRGAYPGALIGSAAAPLERRDRR